MAKKLPKQAIKDRIDERVLVKLTPAEAKINSLLDDQAGGSYNQQAPHVSLKYFRDGFECFSHWEKEELRQFSSFLEHLRGHTWQQVIATGGKEGKRGLAYTPYDVAHVDKAIREHFDGVRKHISDDISFFELRVNQGKLRVHGFRSNAAFFLVLLDREHRVWPMK